jgi:hypothetical protein
MVAPRWLIVVDRDRPDIVEDFSRRFRGWARVMLDRRQEDALYDGPERRRPPVERRNPFLRPKDYRLVYKIEGFELHELTESEAEAEARPVSSPLHRL